MPNSDDARSRIDSGHSTGRAMRNLERHVAAIQVIK
jgi:hypothetical protein